MAISLDSYLNQQQALNSLRPMQMVNQMMGPQRQQAQQTTEQQKQGVGGAAQTGSSSFLRDYSSGVTRLATAADRLADGNAQDLLKGREGQATDQTVSRTVGAAQEMVSAYNDSLRTLNDNVDRGSGVVDQMARMVTDPAPAEEMASVGMSVNQDGTLALDTQRLTDALRAGDASQQRQYTETLSNIADSVRQDAQAGMEADPARLIENDLAEARSQAADDDDPVGNYSQTVRGDGAAALSNQASMGVLMNMIA